MEPSLATEGTAAMGKADGSRPFHKRSRAMPITRLLQPSVFNPEQIREIIYAYESALVSLSLSDRKDPITELVAKAIIECAKTGEFDRVKLRDCALAAIMKP